MTVDENRLNLVNIPDTNDWKVNKLNNLSRFVNHFPQFRFNGLVEANPNYATRRPLKPVHIYYDIK
ncbi:hypothetical protein ATI45_2044 [Marinobacter sp. LV10MA510-1]|nr:hypothetical protein ATI45_2044 [Marinobacter sp. LV10MA510-1]PFG51584.1 hypothetical protein ATG98_0536 [Marinobacter sp. LV10R520-4]